MTTTDMPLPGTKASESRAGVGGGSLTCLQQSGPKINNRLAERSIVMKTQDPFETMVAQQATGIGSKLSTDHTAKLAFAGRTVFFSLVPLEVGIGGEELPVGGWRGGEEIPAGGWRGGEEIPAGGWRGGEEIPPGGWRAPAVRDVYRTEDGTNFFEFVFVPVNSHYEIDILRQPNYGNRDSGQHPTHRLHSSRGGYRICFGDDSVVSSLDQAKHWAAVWAECTMNYILHGDAIPNE